MAKKIQRVVVPKAYLDVLQGKADLLDGAFARGDGGCTVDADMLKAYDKLEKAENRIDYDGAEPYDEPKPVRGGDPAQRGARSG